MDQPSNDAIKELAEKWLNGTITAAEKKIYSEWYNSENGELPFWNGKENSEEELKSNLLKNLHAQIAKQGRSMKLIAIFTTAAIMLLLASTSIIFWTNRNKTNFAGPVTQKIVPGTTKATLTLSNGSKISLTDFKEGTISDASGSKITKDSTGKLSYVNSKNKKPAYYTIATPPGGEYQFTLPDGTKIWLNSNTSITFPTNFTSAKERRVKITGEAYFEVKRSETVPFKVKTAKQQVTVLGTHFNVNSYNEDLFTVTTLLRGSVKVTSADSKLSRMLVPGQQTTLTESNLSIQQVDTNQVVAWIHGDFVFRNEDFKSVMKRIAKWYNVEVKYENKKPITLMPWGGISRSSDIKTVLKMIESTGEVHFKIERRVIIVTN